MAWHPQVHHCPLWHVCVTGRFHPVHEAIPSLQPLADHRRPPDEPDTSGTPSERQHSGEISALTIEKINFVFLFLLTISFEMSMVALGIF